MGKAWSLVLFLLLLYHELCEGGTARKRRRHLEPAAEFSEHSVIEPRSIHSRTKREVSTSREGSGSHAEHLTISFSSDDGRQFILDLQLNRQLIPNNFFQKTHKQGEDVIERPKVDEMELCHYNGFVRGRNHSWAAISTCDGLRGLFHDGTEMFHIERIPDLNSSIQATGDISGKHYLYKHSDLIENDDHKCGFEDTPFAASAQENENRFLRYKREISNSKESNTGKPPGPIQGPWNANVRSRYVELILVVDHQEYIEHDSDVQKVIRIMKEVANVMNALYSPLNIYIALVGVVVWTEYDEITLSTNGDTTLTNFLHYRRERLVKTHPNDNAQLLTGVIFEGGVVGKALKGPICTFEFSGGVNMWHSDVVGLVATTVAHEMGHNFGMEHDTEGCECPDDKCIMAPASSTMKPSFWSSCSLEYLALAFEHGMDYCLRNKPVALFEGPVCGNGFVEPGEACDCGMADHCDNPCCDPATCKLYSNATCATGECCDLTTCRPKSPGSTCRTADHECDLPEYCSGESEFCPEDVFKVDGTSCKVGRAFCYKGTCRTHSDQCKLLWGPSGKKSDNQCYEQNRKGTRHGNCGYNRMESFYIQCQDEDVRCGMLHCSHLNERLEFGMESVSILSHSFINSGGKIIPCRTALVDLGLNDVDPGLAPEGAKCDEGKLCVNKKCIPVENLEIGPNACPDDCNGRGVCNSMGHCHCREGYAPPDCLNPGAGGSMDSGPAGESDNTSLYAVLYAFIFLLFLLLICSFIVYARRRRGEDWKMLAEKARVRGLLSSASTPAEEKDKTASIEISAPIATGEMSNSPSQALLASSEQSNATPNTNKSRSASTDLGHGRSMLSSFGSWASGFSRPSRKSSSSDATSMPKEEKSPSKKNSFVQSLAKSISFPSPRLRLSSKQRGNIPAKYEITVEHREPKDDLVSPGEETPLTPDKPENEEVPITPVAPIVKEEKLETTVSLSPKGTTVSASKSFTARPYRGTLSTSKPYGSTRFDTKQPDSEDKQEETSLLTSKAEETKKPTFTHSSSFSYVRPNLSLSTVPSSRSAGGISSAYKKPPPPPNKPNNVVMSKVSEINTSKSAPDTTDSVLKPADKPVIGKTSDVTMPTTTTTSIRTFSTGGTLLTSMALKPIPSTTVTKAATLPANTIFSSLKETPKTVATTATQPTPTTNLSSTKTTTTALPTTTTTTTTAHTTACVSVTKVTPAITSVTSPISEPSTVTSTAPLTTSKSVSSISSTLTSTTPSTLFSSFKSDPIVKPSLSKTITMPTSLSTAGEKELKLPKSSTLPTVQVGRPLISRPILQAATSSAASLISKAPSTGVSQSSILAGNNKNERFMKDRGSKGVVFCDPITLPSPTNPNTPPIIHQPHTPPSTITVAPISRGATAITTSTTTESPQPVATVITPTWSVVAPPKPDAVVCRIDDSDAGSEPPSSPDHTESKALSGLAKIKAKLKKETKKPKEPGSLSPTSSIKSLEAPPRPERGRLRSLDISGPILQSNVDSKLNLVPVCRAQDVTSPALSVISETAVAPPTPKDLGTKLKSKAPPPPTDSKPISVIKEETKSNGSPAPSSWRSSLISSKESPTEIGSPEQKRAATDSNSSPTKSSRRPASIATTTRSARPTSRPPQPPPPRPGGDQTSPKEHLYDTVRETTSEKESQEKIQPPQPPPRPKSLMGAASIKSRPSEPMESPFTSPQEFVTPTSSPLFNRKSPDTLSTASSSEGDLMREILHEMGTTVANDSIYNSLMRKDKKKKKRLAQQESDE